MAAQKDIRLIVGLGNPGADYVHTRHNVGFLAVDELAAQLGARTWVEKHGCAVARAQVAGHEVILAKPQSFMNTSGGPVSKLMHAEKIAAAERNAPYHDNCNFAQMIHTPVRMVYGTADDNCQTVGGIAAFNRIASKDKQLRLLSGRGHGWHTAGLEDWLFNLP